MGNSTALESVLLKTPQIDLGKTHRRRNNMTIIKMPSWEGGQKFKAHESINAVKTRKLCVMLDYPQEGEKIGSPHYTFRNRKTW